MQAYRQSQAGSNQSKSIQTIKINPDKMAKLALGHLREASDPDCIRAVLAEVVLTFLFVFAGVGAAMTAGTHYFYW